MRRHDRIPAHLVLGKEAIRCGRFGPAATSTRDAGFWIGGQLLGQQDGAFVQAFVAQIEVRELLFSPAHPVIQNRWGVDNTPCQRTCV